MAVTLSLSITQNSQNTVNNTSNVTVKVTASWTGGSNNRVVSADGKPQARGWVKIDGTSYDFASTFNDGQTTTGSKVVCTKTVDVPHDANGAKTLACSASYTTGVSSGTITASASKTLTTIPRKSTLSANNGILDATQVLVVTRQSTSFTHTIVAKCGTASTTICTKSTSTRISFKPPISWASQNTTGTTVSVTYTITTYSGNTSIGSNSYTKTCSIPASIKPSCELRITDAMGYADTYGGYLQGLSTINVVVDALPAYGSPIDRYSTSVYTTNYGKSSFTAAVPNVTGTIRIRSVVTDKRERSGVAEQDITVIEYSKPCITSLSVHRCNEDGTANDQDGEYVQVIFSSDATDLNGQNSANYTIEYKKTTESDYADPIDFREYLAEQGAEVDSLIFSDASFIFKADSGSSYNIRVTVTDNFASHTKTTTASTGYTIMHWSASGRGMAIGKVSELDDVLDIGMQTRMSGGILHPILEPETDLNEILIPNIYIGANLSSNNYTCGGEELPMTSGTFSLEVIGMGEDGQVKQRLTYCQKTTARAWERIYHLTEGVMSWGDWICVSDFDGQLLWSGVYYMSEAQRATLFEPISKQRSGIVLVFSRYSSGAAQNYHFQTFFIPKYQVSTHPGCGHTFMLTNDGSFGLFAAKYLYINDTCIDGNDINEASGTGACGITYTNNAFVLRYVIGV